MSNTKTPRSRKAARAGLLTSAPKAPTHGEIAQAIYSETFKALSKPVQQISQQIPTTDAAAVVGFTEALATLFVAQLARAVADNVEGLAAQRETTIEMLNAALDAARQRLAPKFKFLMPDDPRGIKLAPSLARLDANLGTIGGLVK